MPNVMHGTQPVFGRNRGWRQWHISEIYTGPTGNGRYVPNINDAVLDWDQGWLKVIDVDTTTGLSTLVKHSFPLDNGFPMEDVLLGVGPGAVSESFRLYVNKSVTPHTLAVDSLLHVYGSQNSHVKIFKGTDIGPSGKVISANYNQNGEYISENIPLELAVRSEELNICVKAPAIGYTNENLQDGELATLVVYNNEGGVSSRNVLLVKNTAFVRASEASQRYITHITLESPFISPADQELLLVPINVPIESLTTMGRVHYSDGGSRRQPIDGTKMSIYGTNEYVSTILGQRAPLVLSYKLGPNEVSTSTENGNIRHISRTYYAESSEVVGSYTVKLFIVPQWVDEFSGWRLDYFLYDLDRGDFFFATPYVEPGVNSPPFDPLLYGVTQWLTVAVDIEKVDPRLKPFRHVQSFGIALMADGLSDNTSWLLQYSPGQQPEYGQNLSAEVVFNAIGDWVVDISNGIGSFEEWIEQVYYRTQPLFNPRNETKAPLPTHFVMNLNGIRTEHPLAEWNDPIPSTTGGVEGRSLILEWVRKVGGQSLQLGSSPLKIIHDLSGSSGAPTPP